MHARTRARTLSGMHKRMRTCTYARTHARTHAHAPARTHARTSMVARTHADRHACKQRDKLSAIGALGGEARPCSETFDWKFPIGRVRRRRFGTTHWQGRGEDRPQDENASAQVEVVIQRDGGGSGDRILDAALECVLCVLLVPAACCTALQPRRACVRSAWSPRTS